MDHPSPQGQACEQDIARIWREAGLICDSAGVSCLDFKAALAFYDSICLIVAPRGKRPRGSCKLFGDESCCSHVLSQLEDQGVRSYVDYLPVVVGAPGGRPNAPPRRNDLRAVGFSRGRGRGRGRQQARSRIRGRGHVVASAHRIGSRRGDGHDGEVGSAGGNGERQGCEFDVDVVAAAPVTPPANQAGLTLSRMIKDDHPISS